MRSRRITALVAALILTVSACGGETGGSEAVRADGSVDLGKVTLRIGDQKGTGLQALLKAAGQLDGLPYKVTWSQFTSGPPILEAINAGSLDFGAVGNAPPVFAAAAKSKITIVGVAEKGLGGQAIVVPPGSPIKTPADLRGKAIAVAKGSSANFHLLAVLSKEGLTFADIKPQYLQPPDALAAFSSGKIDAWAIWDPYTAQAESQAKARILVDGEGYANGFEFQITGQEALADKAKAEALGDYVSRIRKAHTWANSHPDEWAKVFSELSGLPEPVVAAAVRRGGFTDLPLDDQVIAREQQVADAFSQAKLIPGTVRIADIVDRRYNDTLESAS
ncbi:ABC transporter substrate-binding protein [Microtetraspora sp. NBRC 13810]|uniref:ABC transporter substrate-binding protein n=1 Tax=Microtetraspora sp. NBRC 13810 TaxID=3030990 RepID=UPI0024A30AF4|nr:ABC transporter substrate-binding protein [Microtetraspora sp. NBRC 13810]GLW12218.1 ABC transporter substrate-binding protein [Microtetraspora sp. NBRC 13810]